MTGTAWLPALRRYLMSSLLGHAVWEVVQLPLFTLWHEAPPRQIAFAVLHCLGGDLVIATTVLVGTLFVVGRDNWPGEGAGRVALLVIALGVAYTGWSEYSNAILRKTWTYAGIMPLVPWLGIGITPLLQWLIIPSLALRSVSR